MASKSTKHTGSNTASNLFITGEIIREYAGEKCTADVRVPQNEENGIKEESNRNDGFGSNGLSLQVASRNGSREEDDTELLKRPLSMFP